MGKREKSGSATTIDFELCTGTRTELCTDDGPPRLHLFCGIELIPGEINRPEHAFENMGTNWLHFAKGIAEPQGGQQGLPQ